MARPLNEDIKVFGLFGYPLSHSVSPEMQNAALQALGIPGIYLAFERNKKDFLRLARSKKLILDGYNLTIPHKETILRYLDSIDATARKVGAVNTVKRVGKRFVGFNTDVYGFKESLKGAGFRAKGKKVILLGAGGAARSVIIALKELGAKQIAIFNRTESKARRLAKEFGLKALRKPQLAGELQNSDLLVNATSLGLNKKDPVPVPFSFLKRKKKMFVHDLIYGRTPLLGYAKRFGHKTADGSEMLLHQGARAFEIWTGKKAPVGVMRKALQDGLLAR